MVLSEPAGYGRILSIHLVESQLVDKESKGVGGVGGIGGIGGIGGYLRY